MANASTSLSRADFHAAHFGTVADEGAELQAPDRSASERIAPMPNHVKSIPPDKLNEPIPHYADDNEREYPLRSFRDWSGKAKPFRPVVGEHFAGGLAFTADVTATQRDDNDTWLDLADGGRYRITASDRSDEHHREGWFYGRVWTGNATFAPTPDGLWLINGAFTAIVYPPDPAYGRGPECVCRVCRKSAPEVAFRKTRTGGRESVCASCRAGAVPGPTKQRSRRSAFAAHSRRSTAAARARLNVCAPVGHKVCPCCHEVYPATKDHFTPDPRTPDGLQHACRKCSGTVAGLAWRNKQIVAS